MPDISKIPEVLYQGLQPYHVHYDNLPLTNILTRIDLVNNQVNINSDILRGANGTVGSLNNRLSVGINDNGTLKYSAVNNALHNIGYHTDGEYDGVEYVRMKSEERDKLSLIDSEANKLYIEIEDSVPMSAISSISYTPSYVTVSTGTLRFKSTDTVKFDFESPDVIKARSVFPISSAHQHHYGLKPAHQTPSSPDYQNFKTTSVNTPFMSGTLRVYVNGIRILDTTPTLVPAYSDISTWTETFISSSNELNGNFTLNRALSSNDLIIIDFDEDLSGS